MSNETTHSSGGTDRATTDRNPAEMTDSELHDEWDRVAGLLDFGGVANIEEDDDELWSRRRKLWNELKSRVDDDAPECPECGGDSWSQSVGEPKTCDQCDLHIGFDHQELGEEIQDYWNTVRSVGAGTAESEEADQDV